MKVKPALFLVMKYAAPFASFSDVVFHACLARSYGTGMQPALQDCIAWHVLWVSEDSTAPL